MNPLRHVFPTLPSIEGLCIALHNTMGTETLSSFRAYLIFCILECVPLLSEEKVLFCQPVHNENAVHMVLFSHDFAVARQWIIFRTNCDSVWALW